MKSNDAGGEFAVVEVAGDELDFFGGDFAFHDWMAGTGEHFFGDRI